MFSKMTTVVLSLLLLALVIGLPGARAQIQDSGGLPSLDEEIEAIFAEAVWGEPGFAASTALANFGFGKRIAGTYYSAAGFGGTVTLYADGNVVAISGTCCGQAPNIQSEACGNWKRTGVREIELTAVVLATQWQLDVEEEDGHFHTGPADVDPGVWGQNWIATPTMRLEFAPGFQSFEGELTTAVWYGDPVTQVLPDILAEDAPPPDQCFGPFPVANTRLPVAVVECDPPPQS